MKIRREPDGKEVVEGLSHWKVNSTQEAMRLVFKAKKKRAMGQTCMNEVSSRSHSILSILILR